MFEPVVIVHAEARYRDLLKEAEVERQAYQAGPAEAKRPRWGLTGLLLALGLLAK